MADSSQLSALTTEQRNPASQDLDRLPTLELLRVMNHEDRLVISAVEAALPMIAAAVDRIAERMKCGGRLFYIGAGTSGRLGVLDASECPPTFNVSPALVTGIIAGGDAALRSASEASEDDPEAGARDLMSHGFGSGDSLAGIAASGRTPYVLGAVRKARNLGALTIGIACAANSPLAQAAEIPVELLVGPEVLTGSTRLKAGTATKMTLNMISTATMVRLGCVYGNLMVNVQPRNEKLVDRAVRIIMAIAEVSRAEAESLFERAGRDVRTAVVMSRAGLDAEAARARLERHGYRLRDALEATEQEGTRGN
jgi:N-acetylmuramic acid 6-phosphate etherase